MLRIAVCVKQVPSTKTVKLDPVHHTLVREGTQGVLNTFDNAALEAALESKCKLGALVGVVTMGPPQAREVLEQCLSRGADEGFLISDPRLAGSDTLVTARVLCALMRLKGYSVAFCGQETVDSGTGHIGPSLGEMLGVPQATYVSRILELDENLVRVEVDLETHRQLLQLSLPAVLVFAKTAGKDQPAGPPGSRGRVESLGLDELGLDQALVGLEGSPTTVVDIDIDIDSLDYMTVDSELPAHARIKSILDGGIQENTSRRIYRGLTQDAVETIRGMIP